MVHLCVSISDNGPRLESMRKGSPKLMPSRGKKANNMATPRRQSRSRTASSRQDRGSCSSTASCPVFSGSYSDEEDDPLLRRKSSPILQGSLSCLNSTNSSPKSSLPSLQGSVSSLQGSLPSFQRSLPSLQGSIHSLQGSLPSLQGSLPCLKGSLPSLKGFISGLKRQSLGSLDNTSPDVSEGGSSPSPQSASVSSSEDDSSWDTNSWSSGATCLLRTTVKQPNNKVLPADSDSDGKTNTVDQIPTIVVAEPEVIYQNLVFSQPVAKGERNGDVSPQSNSIQARKERGVRSVSSSTPGINTVTASSHQRDQKIENRLKFSQFLNEVSNRVLKSKKSPPRLSTLRHWHPNQPRPPLTPPPPPPPPPTLPPSASTPSDMWCSPPSSNLKNTKMHKSRDFTYPIHQWSKTLPSCKILEPGDVLRKVKGVSHSYTERDLELCTKIQAQPSTGRLYLETDIDRVRQLDELVANDTLGKQRKERGMEKGLERGKEKENKREIPCERERGTGVERCKEKEKRKESHQDRKRVMGRGKEHDKERGKPWERDRRMERAVEKERNVVLISHEPLLALQGNSNGSSCQCPGFSWTEGFPRMSYRSASLLRPAVSSVRTQESDGEMQHDTSSFHDHKEDLRKRLSYTTHKLEMVETEFDSTRQYLETELRRAQEELEKFTDKLRRIQSSYAALQRINQDLEDKMHRTSQHHEEEKRALSREIIVLNNHLMEAKITIDKLRGDNDMYRKDCNLAAQLLQCSKSHIRAHKISELPLDFQERLSSHIEKHSRSGGATMAVCHTSYSDAVPTAVIAKVLEKPEQGNSCPVTRSPSPQPQDGDFLSGTGSTDQLNRRITYKTSDLYCSDTALYCPERWQDTERRQSVDLHDTSLLQLHGQNSTDSNPDEEAYHSENFAHHEPPSSFQLHDEFGTGSLPASSSYSSFSIASDEKGGIGRTAGGALSSSHHALYMDWRDGGNGDYESKNMSSYSKDSTGFPKSNSIQHMAAPRSPQKGNAPMYTRTTSCFSEPYHSSTPRLTSSHSMGSTSGLAQVRGGDVDRGRGSVRVPEDELSGRWRKLSVEDINTFSSSYHNITGRISPYSSSERHFAMGPSSKVKAGPLYSSFQDGDDVFHGRMLGQCFTVDPASPNHSPNSGAKHPGLGHRKQDKSPALYRAKKDSQDSECSLFLSGSSKEKEGSGGATAAVSTKKDYVNLSMDSSAESLHQSSLEASSLQHYPCPRPNSRPRPSSSSTLNIGPALPKKTSPRYQKFGSTGLTRKDSLTKAQLYGTLLN